MNLLGGCSTDVESGAHPRQAFHAPAGDRFAVTLLIAIVFKPLQDVKAMLKAVFGGEFRSVARTYPRATQE